MKQVRVNSYVVAAVVLLVFSPASKAQYRTNQKIKPAVPLTSLSGPINLRNIPVYNNAVFKSGCFHGRSAASETYYSQQVPSKIMEWYVDQMDSQGWKILLKTKSMIMAQLNEGERAKVQVTEISTATGFRSSIVLTRSPL